MKNKLKIFDGINNCTLICANKNIDLSSAAAIFKNLPRNKKQTIIFSDINLVDKIRNAANNKIRLIAICEKSKKQNFSDVDFYNNAEDLIAKINTKKSFADSRFFANENILIIGSEELAPIVERLELKSRQTQFEINLDALAYNINYFRRNLKSTTKMCCLVKANSYGLGNYEVACLMRKIGVEYLAVAATDEAVALRRNGIKLPIIVLTPEINNLELLVRNNLEPEIHNYNSLQNFVKICKKLQKRDYPIHIKINTGMNRQGFADSQINELLETLAKTPQVKVKSVFTHLATADEYALAQLKKFSAISERIKKQLPYKIMRHALNSVGIETFPEYQFDMVRLGIGMYGVSEFAAEQTKVVGQFVSVITQIEEVPANEAVGYGRMGIVGNAPKRIGVVPVGYADGFNRRLGCGKTYMTVNGKRAPVIGNICMDLSMIDLTGISANEGDRVEIFGDSPTALELATTLGTISYEILTSIAARVKRVFLVSE